MNMKIEGEKNKILYILDQIIAFTKVCPRNEDITLSEIDFSPLEWEEAYRIVSKLSRSHPLHFVSDISLLDWDLARFSNGMILPKHYKAKILSPNVSLLISLRKQMSEDPHGLNLDTGISLNKTHKPITKLEFVQEGKSYTEKWSVIINKTFLLKVRKGSKRWDVLRQISYKKRLDFDKVFHKSCINYFRYHKDNPLYKRGLFSLTDILGQCGEHLVPLIDISNIAEATFKRRDKHLERI